MQSKVFTFRTNASRAARKMGLSKAPLIAVSGGYVFDIPDPDRVPAVSPVKAAEMVDHAALTAALFGPEPPAIEASPEPEPAPATTAEEPQPSVLQDVVIMGGRRPGKTTRYKKAIEATTPKKAARPAKATKPVDKLSKMHQDVMATCRKWTAATILEEMTGWCNNTLRGRMSEIKRHGVPVERRRVDGVTEYRIAGA